MDQGRKYSVVWIDIGFDSDGSRENDVIYSCVWFDGKQDYSYGIYGMDGSYLCQLDCKTVSQIFNGEKLCDDWGSAVLCIVCISG